MKLKLIDKFSDLNPQLFREIKGRLKSRNVAIASGISILGQLILLGAYANRLPDPHKGYPRDYCLESFYNKSSAQYTCLTDRLGQALINWDLWWVDIFLWLSFVAVFALFVAGSYMLIGDLAKEERRGTLNFIRVSPRSTQTILLGKLLGVPILLYLSVFLAIPLHLWAGLSAHIPLGFILGFDAALVAGCIFFYSAAILFGLSTAYLGGFQAWLGSGLVFGCVAFTSLKTEQYSDPVLHGPIDWLNLFNPAMLLPSFISQDLPTLVEANRYFNYDKLASWQWFYSPLGASVVSILGLMLLNYCLWTYWIWQSLSRRFPNPSATIISKRQSYNLVACIQLMMLGFALQQSTDSSHYNFIESFFENLCWILSLNLVLFFGLMAVLSPHRQTVQDWARYSQTNKFKSLWKDLIWGEKSPAPVAIALNALFCAGLLVPWILIWPEEAPKTAALAGLPLFVTVIIIYAVVAQLMLLIKTQKRSLWAAGTVGTLIALPILVGAVLTLEPSEQPLLWLFSAVSWATTEYISLNYLLFGFLGQVAILTGLSVFLKRRVDRLGESATQALLKAGKMPTA